MLAKSVVLSFVGSLLVTNGTNTGAGTNVTKVTGTAVQGMEIRVHAGGGN
jgi:hypothetical protein